MLMLAKTVPVTVSDLARIPCPEPTETWRPYPHAEVVSTLADRMRARGLAVRASRLTLVNGALYPDQGVRVEVPGARLFGSFDLEPAGKAFPPGGRGASNDQAPASSQAPAPPLQVAATGATVRTTRLSPSPLGTSAGTR